MLKYQIAIFCILFCKSNVWAQSEWINTSQFSTLTFELAEIIGSENALTISKISNGVFYVSQGIKHKTNEILVTKMDIRSGISKNFQFPVIGGHKFDPRSVNCSELHIINDTTLIGDYENQLYKLNINMGTATKIDVPISEINGVYYLGGDTIFFSRSACFNGDCKYYLESWALNEKRMIDHIDIKTWPMRFFHLLRSSTICHNDELHVVADVSAPVLHFINNELKEVQILNFENEPRIAASDFCTTEKQRKKWDKKGFEGMFKLFQEKEVNKATNISFLNDSTICYLASHFSGKKLWNDILLFKQNNQGVWSKENKRQTILNFSSNDDESPYLNLSGRNYTMGEEKLIMLENKWNSTTDKMEVLLKIYSFHLKHE